MYPNPQILLTHQEALPLFQKNPEWFVGALAPDAVRCAEWSKTLSDIPVGLPLDCPEWIDTEEPLATLQYIRLCKKQFRPLLYRKAAFYYLRRAGHFTALRAAVLALGDLSGKTVMAELSIDAEGCLPDGTDILAAVGVLQRIGVTAIVFTASDPTALTEALEITVPHARLSIGIQMCIEWLQAQVPTYNAEFFLPADEKENELIPAIEQYAAAYFLEREHNDLILAPDGKNAHFVSPTIDISDEIECGPRLEEAVLQAEEDTGALKLLLETEDDIIALETYGYMISRPVCLCASSAELLEEGLRVYPGLALYDGTWEQPEEIVKYWEQKYGLIRL